MLHQFKVVLGSLEHDTQAYNSNANFWESKPCRPTVRGELRPRTDVPLAMGELPREILVYDYESASWSSIDVPGAAHPTISTQSQHYCNDSLGAWNARILGLGDDSDSSSLSLWELADYSKQGWRVFDTMPSELYKSWLRF